MMKTGTHGMRIDHSPETARLTMRSVTANLPGDLAGVPIEYDAHSPILCKTEGAWWFKRLVLGRQFFALPFGVQMAVLLHEEGHIRARHAETRFWRVLKAHLRHPLVILGIATIEDDDAQENAWNAFLEKSGLASLARAQEFEADDFARKQGYGDYLAQFLGMLEKQPSGPLHPSNAERAERLRKALHLTAPGIGNITAHEPA